jgi:hypothetical protein
MNTLDSLLARAYQSKKSPNFFLDFRTTARDNCLRWARNEAEEIQKKTNRNFLNFYFLAEHNEVIVYPAEGDNGLPLANSTEIDAYFS